MNYGGWVPPPLPSTLSPSTLSPSPHLPCVCLPDIIAHDKISPSFPLQVINNWSQRMKGGCTTLEVSRQAMFVWCQLTAICEDKKFFHLLSWMLYHWTSFLMSRTCLHTTITCVDRGLVPSLGVCVCHSHDQTQHTTLHIITNHFELSVGMLVTVLRA